MEKHLSDTRKTKVRFLYCVGGMRMKYPRDVYATLTNIDFWWVSSVGQSIGEYSVLYKVEWVFSRSVVQVHHPPIRFNSSIGRAPVLYSGCRVFESLQRSW